MGVFSGAAFALACITAVGVTGGPTARAAASTVLFRSAAYPYSIRYPAGWAHRTVKGKDVTADQFGLGPWGHDEINVTITAVTAADASPSDDDALRAKLEAERRSSYGTVTEVGTVRVDGHRLVAYSWTHTVNGTRLTDSEAVFADRGHVWVAVMVSDPGAGQRRWLPTFESMLASFRPR